MTDSIRIRIAMRDSIRYSIRTQMADSQSLFICGGQMPLLSVDSAKCRVKITIKAEPSALMA